MLPAPLIACLMLTLSKLTSAASASTTSPKRGLIYIETSTSAADLPIWGSSSSDLTWYYNYKPNPTSGVNSKLEFVPMFFGQPNSGDAAFYTTVNSQISSGANITHVLGFNEPDGGYNVGGSNIDPRTAASLWKDQVEPLKGKVKLGAPATMSNTNGITWLQAFYTACNGGCTADFYPLHFYGDFQGLASYMGEFQAAFGNTSKLWITEYGYPNMPLNETQSFFNVSLEYFDRLSYVDRYSYFGAFRSSVSNVGPNPAMLDSQGQLTDIGAWYLGESATGVVPNSAPSRASLSYGIVVAALVLLAAI